MAEILALRLHLKMLILVLPVFLQFSLFVGAAGLKQQLAALQQESEEEQRASRREAMKLREQLEQACQERDEARTELQRLGEALEVATAAKVRILKGDDRDRKPVSSH